MHSRARMLLEKEYTLLQRDPAWGIEAEPLSDDNFFEWVATIQGLKDTIWEGGVFAINLRFDEHFNSVPPVVHFHTIPFHPNIDMNTGRPCVDFLDDYNTWKESYSLLSVLLAIQCLLSYPVLEAAVNPEACSILQESPDLYRQMVLDCVTASQRVHAGQSLQVEDAKVRFEEGEENQLADRPKSSQASQVKVSFDDYLTTWNGIATSKAEPNMRNPLLEAIKDDPKLQTAHFGLPLEELQQHMKKQLQEHNSLMYGNFAAKPNKADSQERKLDHINKMRKIYLPSRKIVPPPSTAQSDTGDPWEKEVDDLVEWTANLDEGELMEEF
ncbi:ubiquitin-conjugating enzyme E2 U-like isoform X2 [Acanthaster planci]|nr:ubiquitin-conjugating enzyme E2 U-like isoform X2 [Acanthaster planci]XP_022105525.1 ubiquitin-conjugating enzyme E2 U-like isoform X2 [Acanthaster planci]XP_022105526.1 ubiquitin-conjugating enzyme E2 U-like isoform X2 [Acanthaster planci]XP_022105527.1 ubiquitin-conjugating enzyme E2 U-like isoform X2 [Acanthaster planci]